MIAQDPDLVLSIHEAKRKLVFWMKTEHVYGHPDEAQLINRTWEWDNNTRPHDSKTELWTHYEEDETLNNNKYFEHIFGISATNNKNKGGFSNTTGDRGQKAVMSHTRQ